MAVEIKPGRELIAKAGPPAPRAAASLLAVSVRKRFVSNERDFELNTSFVISPGITILFGASGAGKTTVLNCIAGLSQPDSGRIAVGERVFFDSSAKKNIPARQRGIGYVFQELALFPHLSAEKNIEYGLAALDSPLRRRRTQDVLDSFHISHLRARRPSEISGGERQRVALARTLVTDPCLVLLDEPLAALDAATKTRILEDLRAWNQAHQIPILYVTHNREEVFALGQHVLVLQDGRLIVQGTPHEVMTAPHQETVAQLAGFENILDVIVLEACAARGTMNCRIAGSSIEIETPLVRADAGLSLRVGIRAGDILLATTRPAGISARNLVPGMILSLEQRDVIVVARINCGIEICVHLTLAARDSLGLQTGDNVWLIIKTHSCHVMSAC